MLPIRWEPFSLESLELEVAFLWVERVPLPPSPAPPDSPPSLCAASHATASSNQRPRGRSVAGEGPRGGTVAEEIVGEVVIAADVAIEIEL